MESRNVDWVGSIRAAVHLHTPLPIQSIFNFPDESQESSLSRQRPGSGSYLELPT